MSSSHSESAVSVSTHSMHREDDVQKEPARLLSPKRKPRGRLSMEKCHSCRVDKQKCLPQNRQWPQRCNRCIEQDRTCSVNTKKTRYTKATQALQVEVSSPLNASLATTPINPDRETLASQIYDLSARCLWLARFRDCANTGFSEWSDLNAKLEPAKSPCGILYLEEMRTFARRKYDILQKQFSALFTSALDSYNTISAIYTLRFLVSIIRGEEDFDWSRWNIPLSQRFASALCENGDIGMAYVFQMMIVQEFFSGEDCHCAVNSTTANLEFHAALRRLIELHGLFTDYIKRLEGTTYSLTPWSFDIVPRARDMGCRVLKEAVISDIKAKDAIGRTLLHKILSCNAGLAEKLLPYFSMGFEQEDELGRTALHVACTLPGIKQLEQSDLKLVSLLIGSRASVDTAMHGGLRPLHIAILKSKDEVAEKLLAAGANPNTAIDLLFSTCLGLAILQGDVNLVSLLCRYNADVLASPKTGYPTAFALAAEKNEAEIIEVMSNSSAVHQDELWDAVEQAWPFATMKNNHRAGAKLQQIRTRLMSIFGSSFILRRLSVSP